MHALMFALHAMLHGFPSVASWCIVDAVDYSLLVAISKLHTVAPPSRSKWNLPRVLTRQARQRYKSNVRVSGRFLGSLGLLCCIVSQLLRLAVKVFPRHWLE